MNLITIYSISNFYIQIIARSNKIGMISNRQGCAELGLDTEEDVIGMKNLSIDKLIKAV